MLTKRAQIATVAPAVPTGELSVALLAKRMLARRCHLHGVVKADAAFFGCPHCRSTFRRLQDLVKRGVCVIRYYTRCGGGT
jgi:hypothetical protein